MAQIAHAVGYFVSWLYLCAFAIVFVPFFSVSNHSTLLIWPLSTRHHS